MATFYGSDTYCLTDLPLIDTQVTDPKVLIGQRIARRLQTPRGALALINDDPDFGWDIRQYVNAKMTVQERIAAQAQIEAECLKDQEIDSCAVTMTFSGTTLTIDLKLDAGTGPFSLTLNVDQLTVALVFDFNQ